jgi:uncharacterized protein YjeT (DUF2065 family)
MSNLRWIGAVILIMGIVSLFVPIPQRERHGIKVGDVSLGVVTENDKKIPVALSAVMILGGLGAMALGGQRST